MDSSPTIHAGPLGAQTQYQDGYDKSLLHSMARAEGRQAVGLDGWQLAGEDQWTAHEFSWLNARGKPEVAELSFNVPVTSPNIIESKSMKLYLNGFSQTRFANVSTNACKSPTDWMCLSDKLRSCYSVATVVSETAFAV